MNASEFLSRVVNVAQKTPDIYPFTLGVFATAVQQGMSLETCVEIVQERYPELVPIAKERAA